MRLALLAALMLSSPALAQNGKVWTPAPVPGDGVPTVPPTERAGGPGLNSLNAGPSNATPFSGPSSGTLSTGGQTSPAVRDAPGSPEAGTPNLSR